MKIILTMIMTMKNMTMTNDDDSDDYYDDNT